MRLDKIEIFRRFVIEELYLKRWIHKTWLSEQTIKWSWNNDGSVSVIGDVIAGPYGKEKLPVCFKNVTGHFILESDIINTLKGCPKRVKEWFGFEYPKVSSLEYSPRIVDGWYHTYVGGKFTEKEIRNVCKVGGKIRDYYETADL